MPELPEVETIVRDLAQLLPGRTINSVQVIHGDVVEGEDPSSFVAGLTSRTITGVDRRAKNIVLDLVDQRLVVNLGMTGRLLMVAAGESLPSHPAVRFSLEDRGELVYHDVRRFGFLRRFSPQEWEEWESRLGPEPLGESFAPEQLYQSTRKSRSPIKNWIMDQRRVVGVGNIYASEALFRAGVSPSRTTRSLDFGEITRLHDSIRTVLREAIDFRGTTFLDYRDARGERGGFARRLRVYGRAGLPCPTCATPIERSVQAGRSTFHCPACQS